MLASVEVNYPVGRFRTALLLTMAAHAALGTTPIATKCGVLIQIPAGTLRAIMNGAAIPGAT